MAMIVLRLDLRRVGRAGTRVARVALLIVCLCAAGCASPGDEPRPVPDSGAALPREPATASKATTPEASTGVLQMALRDRQATYDFGYVQPLSKHAMTLVIRNTLSKAVTIRKIVSECTCMSADVPQAAVPPGGEVRIAMDFKAPKQTSVYSKRLLIWTSEPTVGKLVLRVTARIALPLNVKPIPVRAGSLILGQWQRCDLTISNDDDAAIRLTGSESTNVQVAADVAGKVIPGKGAVTVPIRVKGLEARNSASSLVTIRTDCPTQGQLVVPVTYTVLGTYELSWGSMDLGTVRPGQRRQVTLDVASHGKGGGDFVRECRFDPRINVRGTRPTVETVANRAALRMAVTAGSARGAFSGEIVLRLAGHDEEVRVTVRGIVAPDD
jgi:Protein of unknown function (DUF1573)